MERIDFYSNFLYNPFCMFVCVLCVQKQVKHGRNGQETARSEVLVTQVNGYALVLQIVAPTQKDVDNILKNFS